MLSKLPEPWKSFLKEIDKNLSQITKLHCIGGFVIAMLYDLKRETSDLDFISVIPEDVGRRLNDLAGKGSTLNKKHKVYLDSVTVATYPENYEDRLVEMFSQEFNFLKLYALESYDLALSKLERNSPKDQEDVLRLARSDSFDLKLFKERYNQEFKVYVEDNIRHRSTFNFWVELIEESLESESQ